jgi:uncharacterized protein (TIGR02391 family)
MADVFRLFEEIVRQAHLFSDEDPTTAGAPHPFEQRGIFDALPKVVRDLFDNGHYAQTTFEAFKFLDREVARIAGSSETGKSLMMKAFQEMPPHIKLTALVSESDKSEQEGMKFIFAGSMMAIRNPRGHEFDVVDTIDDCLDHLTLVSMLLRRLETAGHAIHATKQASSRKL